MADFNQAIRLDPKYMFAYYNRGLAYYNKWDYDRAIADYNQAIQLDPNYVHSYINRGAAYYMKSDYTRARADYTRALQIDPNNTTARNNLNSLGDLGR
jgi:tetratricopeptide (TPR) repeat protein